MAAGSQTAHGQGVLLQPTSHHIPVLDGWRGIAIALVLFDHVQYALFNGYAHPWLQTGQHGVTIFFVLSGFLITTKLLEGPIDLKRFYIRRFFRLIPVAWIFLVVLLLFDRLTGLRLTTWQEIRSCLFFYRNFAGMAGGAGGAGHFWSLSLEEQFYLVWPFTLLVAGALRSRWIAAIGAVSCAMYRWYSWAYYDRNLLGNETQVRADAILVGCLLALLLVDRRVVSSAKRWSKWLSPLALAVVLFCITRFRWLPPLYESVSIAVLLAASTMHPKAVPSRLLCARPLMLLGTISYSLYIWQGPFMAAASRLSALVVLGIALPVVTLCSYYWIERPSIRIGSRLSARLKKKATPAVPLSGETTLTGI
jgi:peptidoglycan/LPS O-acetylase OafA/YrhL